MYDDDNQDDDRDEDEVQQEGLSHHDHALATTWLSLSVARSSAYNTIIKLNESHIPGAGMF